MNDTVFKVVMIAAFVVCVILFGVILWGITYAALDDAEYECKSTGRRVLTMLPAGKVMVPIMQDETVCKRVEK